MNNGLSEQEATNLFEETFNKLRKGESLNGVAPVAEVANPEPAPAAEPVAEAVVEPVPSEPVETPEVKPPVVEEPAKAQETPSPQPEPEAKPAHVPDSRDLSWIKDLPDDLKAKVVKLEEERRLSAQQYRSNAGRMSAYQRTIAELKTQLASVPLQATIPAAKLETDKDYETLAENDPKFATYLKKTIEQAMNQASLQTAKAVDARLRATLEPMWQAQQEEYKQAQKEFLESQIPDVDNVVTSDKFQNWFKRQVDTRNDEVIRMLDSPHAHHVIKALQLYDLDEQAGIFNRSVPQAEVPVQIKPPALVPAAAPQAVKIAQARAAKSGTAGGISAAAPTPLGGDGSFDEDAYFKSVYNKLRGI